MLTHLPFLAKNLIQPVTPIKKYNPIRKVIYIVQDSTFDNSNKDRVKSKNTPNRYNTADTTNKNMPISVLESIRTLVVIDTQQLQHLLLFLTYVRVKIQNAYPSCMINHK